MADVTATGPSLHCARWPCKRLLGSDRTIHRMIVELSVVRVGRETAKLPLTLLNLTAQVGVVTEGPKPRS